VDSDAIAALDELATRLGTSRSEAVRQAPKIVRELGNVLDGNRRSHQRSAEPVSGGEFLAELSRAAFTRGERERVGIVTDLLMRAGEDTSTSPDVSGIVPVSTYPEAAKFIDRVRHVVNTTNGFAGPRKMPPKGSTFTRPTFRTRAAAVVQALEGDAITNVALELDGDTVHKARVVALASLSEQIMDWAQAEDIVDDLVDAYALGTESRQCAAVEAATLTSEPLFDWTETEAVHTAFVNAGATVYAACGVLPDVIYAGANARLKLASLVNDVNSAEYPNLAVQGPAGLPVVLGIGLTDDFAAVACSRFVESFELDKGLNYDFPRPSPLVPGGPPPLPARMSFDVFYRGDFAPHVYPEGLCGVGLELEGSSGS
jgi:hypothetical protein